MFHLLKMLCRLLCTGKRSKVKQKPKGPNCYIIDIRELLRIKSAPAGSSEIILKTEMDGLRNGFIWGRQSEQCDCTIYTVL